MPTFCTISTVSHLFKTFALADSLSGYGVILHVLVIDGIAQDMPENVVIHHLDELDDQLSLQLISKYKGNKNKLRWAMKPCFMSKLLLGETKVIYVDNDIYFYSDPKFLSDLLDVNKILLTPHFYPADPYEKQNWLEANFRVGLYNAGFVGANQQAVDMLQWWAGCCLYNIKKSFWRGLFDDQKYLDLVPVIFDGAKIIKHRGCNLSGWNDKGYPAKEPVNEVVFVHFAELTMEQFSERDHRFNNLYEQYVSALNRYKPAFSFRKKRMSTFHFISYFYYVKWRILRSFNQ